MFLHAMLFLEPEIYINPSIKIPFLTTPVKIIKVKNVKGIVVFGQTLVSGMDLSPKEVIKYLNYHNKLLSNNCGWIHRKKDGWDEDCYMSLQVGAILSTPEPLEIVKDNG